MKQLDREGQFRGQSLNSTALFPLLLVACSGLWFVTACRQEVQDPSTIVLENSQVRRVLEKEDEVWRTRSFSRADGSDEVRITSEEFQILLMDGTKVGLRDYRAEGDPVIRKSDNDSVVEITYIARGEAQPEAPGSILVKYSLAAEPYLRKTLTLTMEEGQAVDRLEVERFKTGWVCDRGGVGQPVFIADSWFAGLEYPGSFVQHNSGLVTLAHYPGLARKNEEQDGKWVIRSKTAVLGSGLEGDPLELAFHDYLETIRQPSPKHLLANTWTVDRGWGEGGGFRVKDFLEYHDLFQKNLDPYGIKLDSVQPDLKGFEPRSVSMPAKTFFPQGYRPLSEQLESRGSSLSLWFALNGTGIEDVDWMSGQGYEKTNGPYQDFWGHFCVSAPKYKAAVRETLKKTIEDGNISYFKHDFVQMICSAEGHNHLPTVRHGFEANLDATLELLDYERQLKPDILSAPTSYVWLSPWWLMHANYIYMGVGDYGDVATRPQLSYREWEMAFRDGHFFKIYNKFRIPIPMSSMITHTLLPNQFKGATDSLREWSDLNAMVFGRGLRLIDMYHDGRKLTPDFWRATGEFVRWYQDQLEILGTTRMIGGSPRMGDAYGYAHWKDDRGILCLRNPEVGEQVIRVPFDKTVFYRGENGQPFRGRVIYPYLEDLPHQFTSGKPMLFTIPGYTVMLIELEPGQAPQIVTATPERLIEGGGLATVKERDWSNFYQDPSMTLTATVSLQVPDEEMARCDLFLIARSNGDLPEFPTLTLNGKPAVSKTVEGHADTPAEAQPPRDTDAINWSIRALDLRAFRGQWVELVAASAKNPVPFLLEAWIIADRPVKTQATPEENLPPSFWRQFRRQTVRLLSHNLSRVPIYH